LSIKVFALNKFRVPEECWKYPCGARVPEEHWKLKLVWVNMIALNEFRVPASLGFRRE
jgi:hypothetical protein